jgi:hypothetical protein
MLLRSEPIQEVLDWFKDVALHGLQHKMRLSNWSERRSLAGSLSIRTYDSREADVKIPGAEAANHHWRVGDQVDVADEDDDKWSSGVVAQVAPMFTVRVRRALDPHALRAYTPDFVREIRNDPGWCQMNPDEYSLQHPDEPVFTVLMRRC